MANEKSDRTVLFLKKDNTFFARTGSDIAGIFVSKGTWKKNRDTLLTYAGKLRLIDSVVLQKISSISGEVRVRILDIKEGKPLQGLLVKPDNEITQVSSDNNGYASLKPDAESIALEYLGTKDSVKIQKGVTNQVTLYLDVGNTRTFSIARSWKIRGRKLNPIDTVYAVFARCK